ncbi:zinc-containing long-chain alcohol dehydrogenase [Fusarium agapanthi]|uniref:Zinc-containing long-chain alcohol dehydrogenase n=1 Tax=Fusarium agapanthi TaxID=1803897 RepID=A0A9P5B790_9HYPO|nr:zinc-containing long-chain alcohol dehydrogenase [Fusarium agapanthi]
MDSIQFTTAIVAHAPKDGKRNWKLGQLQLRAPSENEAIVETVASGVCHTDLGCGTDPDGTPRFSVPPYPRVLGHEGSGEAFQISKPASQKVGGSFFGQSSFAKLTRVQETSLVNVTDFITHPEDLKLFAPLGCGIQTGAGTITELTAAKPDDKVAIMGLGRVGLAAIMGAKLGGCRTIIGIDRVTARIEMAERLGATHGIDTSSVANLGSEVRRITDGSGSTITVDATGVMPLIQQGLDFTANQGKMVLLGVAPMTVGLEISVVPFMVTGKQFMGSMEGGLLLEDYIPRMIRWFRKASFR